MTALLQREVSHLQGIDRNTLSANSQRIRRSKDLSGSNDACTGVLPNVSGGGRDDSVGEIQAFSQDGGGEVRPSNTAGEMQGVWQQPRLATRFSASVPALPAEVDAKGDVGV
ncbi:MAG: hypothetical protein GY792_12880 [Gammaproteobacteria bacterium]|nr:hypothetical protein [Gammaproteobacteria bacterium]